ncbi:hypothetical protein SLA2020_369570 [Shorea laevis]
MLPNKADGAQLRLAMVVGTENMADMGRKWVGPTWAVIGFGSFVRDRTHLCRLSDLVIDPICMCCACGSTWVGYQIRDPIRGCNTC